MYEGLEDIEMVKNRKDRTGYQGRLKEARIAEGNDRNGRRKEVRRKEAEWTRAGRREAVAGEQQTATRR